MKLPKDRASSVVGILGLTLTLFISTNGFAIEPVIQVKKVDGRISEYKLLPVKHDPSHAQTVKNRLMSKKRSVANLPSNYSISKSKLPSIRDQGLRGTCAYFATAGLIETYYMAQDAKKYKGINLSEECLVDLRNWMYETVSYTGTDKPTDRPDPNGDYPTLIIQTVKKYGIPAEKNYSNGLSCIYDGTNQAGGSVSVSSYSEIFSSAFVTSPSTSFAKGFTFDETTSPTIDRLKELISNNIPVEVGVLVYNRYVDPYQGSSDWAYDPNLDTEKEIAGAHAIQLVGYKTTGTKTTFTFKNSWDTSWGNLGYGTIDDALLTHSWSYDASLDFAASLH